MLLVLALSFSTAASVAQQLTESLPVVTAASVPLYPPLARQAHIEGEVRLEISTDGDRISNVDIVSGQRMLAEATKENVNTWRFRPHTRTRFVVTFRYRLLPVPEESRCSATNANSNVALKLPKEVDVSVNEAWVCDTATPVR
jgi:TonB family protein